MENFFTENFHLLYIEGRAENFRTENFTKGKVMVKFTLTPEAVPSGAK